jgi:hypothetical protein
LIVVAKDERTEPFGAHQRRSIRSEPAPRRGEISQEKSAPVAGLSRTQFRLDLARGWGLASRR